ncbi:MAG: hypothetical protein NWE79_07155 [Candidatus Bathyarchaeota archaeon]|nr:hypothetical protein [Candidatus Bathyarchaeota archaeon]
MASIVFSVAFIVVIWILGPKLQPFLDTLLPDKGASWYYWKLPTRNALSMLIVWILYLAHQFSVWGAIYWARRNLSGKPPSSTLNRYNVASFVINALFVVLHLAETHLLFDGLAQDVPIWTSQGSVIIMLVVVIVIESRRRGLILGRRLERPFTPGVTRFFRENHMYVFAWALVYTFWFHPMAVDPQLLSGFIYMFFLFTQMSLAWTRIHLDSRWIVFLESYVAIHALIVAVYNTLQHGSSDIWPMFFAGFAFMFVFTQIYGLKIGRKIRLAITGAYILFVAWLYLPGPLGLGRELAYLTRLEVLWIPMILYLLALVFGGGVYLFRRE